MPKSSNVESDQYSNKETEQRREAALKKMQATPPKPHKDAIGKGAKSPKPKAQKGRIFRHQGR